MDKAKIIADIAETKSAIADADTPADMKDSLTKALASMEAKLSAIESEEKKVAEAEQKKIKAEEKKAKEKEKKPKNPKMQIMFGEKNLDESTPDEILEKFTERRNTAKAMTVKAKTKSVFVINAGQPAEKPTAENLEVK